MVEDIIYYLYLILSSPMTRSRACEPGEVQGRTTEGGWLTVPWQVCSQLICLDTETWMCCVFYLVCSSGGYQLMLCLVLSSTDDVDHWSLLLAATLLFSFTLSSSAIWYSLWNIWTLLSLFKPLSPWFYFPKSIPDFDEIKPGVLVQYSWMVRYITLELCVSSGLHMIPTR